MTAHPPYPGLAGLLQPAIESARYCARQGDLVFHGAAEALHWVHSLVQAEQEALNAQSAYWRRAAQVIQNLVKLHVLGHPPWHEVAVRLREHEVVQLVAHRHFHATGEHLGRFELLHCRVQGAQHGRVLVSLYELGQDKLLVNVQTVKMGQPLRLVVPLVPLPTPPAGGRPDERPHEASPEQAQEPAERVDQGGQAFHATSVAQAPADGLEGSAGHPAELPPPPSAEERCSHGYLRAQALVADARLALLRAADLTRGATSRALGQAALGLPDLP